MNKCDCQRREFGQLPDATPIECYTLTNGRGLEVEVLTYGGIIRAIRAPDRSNRRDNVVLGYDNLADYLERSPYFGALIGRYANRIAGGCFTLDEQRYRVSVNEGRNTLHGGREGFDRHVWSAEAFGDHDCAGVMLSHRSPDGDMGFPGELDVQVLYALGTDDTLEIDYRATTDQATVINLTNHAYFNLAGAGQATVLDHLATVDADCVTPIDAELLPTGEFADVDGTPFDFRTPRAFGERIDPAHPQLGFAEPRHGGYDHNWVLNTAGALTRAAATVLDPASGRRVTMYTTEPGVQIYTGNGLDPKVHKTAAGAFAHWGAFTLEAQRFPDAPNQPAFPDPVLRPGQRYRQTTRYRFTID